MRAAPLGCDPCSSDLQTLPRLFSISDGSFLSHRPVIKGDWALVEDMWVSLLFFHRAVWGFRLSQGKGSQGSWKPAAACNIFSISSEPEFGKGVLYIRPVKFPITNMDLDLQIR